MTLTRLVFAWVPVAVWFVITTIGTALLAGLPSRPAGEGGHWVGVPLAVLKWRVGEAAVLTMLGSLWFDSLGSGEWWLVFLLIGAIAAIAGARPGRAALAGVSADLVRYVFAGAILAWRLG